MGWPYINISGKYGFGKGSSINYIERAPNSCKLANKSSLCYVFFILTFEGGVGNKYEGIATVNMKDFNDDDVRIVDSDIDDDYEEGESSFSFNGKSIDELDEDEDFAVENAEELAKKLNKHLPEFLIEAFATGPFFGRVTEGRRKNNNNSMRLHEKYSLKRDYDEEAREWLDDLNDEFNSSF